MTICCLDVYFNISRLYIIVCLLSTIFMVQIDSSFAIDSTLKTTTSTYSSLKKTVMFQQTPNQTTTITTHNCVAEVIDETLYYMSVGYRAFAGALIVPIIICFMYNKVNDFLWFVF